MSLINTLLTVANNRYAPALPDNPYYTGGADQQAGPAGQPFAPPVIPGAAVTSPTAYYGPTVPASQQPPDVIPHVTSGPPPAAPFPGYLTDAQQRAQAQADVNAAYAYRQSELERQQTQAGDYAHTSADLIRNIDAALAEVYRKIGPAIQGAYQGAAKDTSAFAQGYSDAMRQTIGGSADQANTLLSKLGAQNPVPNVGEQAGNVLYGIGGSIPAATLEKQGAAFASAADFLPGTAVAQGREDVLRALAQGKITQDQFASQLGELAAQKGSAFTSAINQLRQQQAGLQSAAANRKVSARNATLAEAGRNRRATVQANAANVRAAAQINAANARAAAAGDRAAESHLISEAKRLDGDTQTIHIITPKGRIVDTGKPTKAAQDATTVRGQKAADFATGQLGYFYQYDPKSGQITQTLQDGKPVETLGGQKARALLAAAGANKAAIYWSIAGKLSTQSGAQVRPVFNPDGSVAFSTVKAKNPTTGALEPVPTRAELDSDRKYQLAVRRYNHQVTSDQRRYLLTVGRDDRAALAQAQRNSPYLLRYDKDGHIVGVPDGKGGYLVTPQEAHRRTTERQGQTRIDQAAEQHAFEQANAQAGRLAQGGIVYTPVRTPNGWIAQPVLVKGMPKLTVAAAKLVASQRPKTKVLSARDAIVQNSVAEKGARIAFQGGTLDEKAPAFRITSKDPGDGTGWSEPIKGADGKLVGYHNHYQPMDMASAFQNAIENKIEPTIAWKHLRQWYLGHPDRGGPLTGAQRKGHQQFVGALKKAGIKSREIPASQVPVITVTP